jgi:hypothetical protein
MKYSALSRYDSTLINSEVEGEFYNITVILIAANLQLIIR